MNQPLSKIRQLIKLLPGKDSCICEEYLNKRNFEAIREIVESDIYKIRQKSSTEEFEKGNDYTDRLLQLKSSLDEYISYLDIPYNSDDICENYYV